MKILFLTLARITSIEDRDIYTDLMCKFRNEGHELFIATPSERRFGENTKLLNEKGVNILQIRTLNIQKTTIIEKGIGTLSIEYQYLKAINKYFNHIKFDLILYSTPPITFTNLISSLKKKHSAITYLLLKDIFPQNAVDLKMISKNSLIYRYFRKREKKLYEISDWIGCMSQANIEYILKHNSWLSKDKVEVNPNSIDLVKQKKGALITPKIEYLELMQEKIVFLYGGNLGKPQGIDFLLEVIEKCEDIKKAFFIVIGSGTESHRVEKWFNSHCPKNAIFIPEVPKDEYDMLVRECHVGLIFLNRHFTIPNYPSRILTYMENKMPVLCATDKNTDVGRDAEKYEYGYWCESGNLDKFYTFVNFLTNNEEIRKKLGENSFQHVKNYFSVDFSYKIVMNHFPT